MLLTRFGVPVLALTVLGLLTITASAETAITNGDLETGDFTGWEIYTTPNGKHSNPAITLFDVNGDGVQSHAVQMSVGQLSYSDGGCGFDAVCRNSNLAMFEGGGVRQAFIIGPDEGSVTLSADVAVDNRWIADNTGGLFELMLDGEVVDSLLVTNIASGALVRGMLTKTAFLVEGIHTVSVQARRPWGTWGLNSSSPQQYIDNVIVDVTVPDVITRAERLESMGVTGNGIEEAPGLKKPVAPADSSLAVNSASPGNAPAHAAVHTAPSDPPGQSGANAESGKGNSRP